MEYEFSSEPRPGRILFGKDDKPTLLAGSDMGPFDVSDVSQGPTYQRWDINKEINGDVVLSSQDGKSYVLFNDPTIMDIDVTFDQLGREVVAYKNATGVYVWNYNVELSQMSHTFIGIGDDPRISMDLKFDSTGLSDVILWYRVGNTARRRLQRYRFNQATEVTAPNFNIIRLKSCGMGENGRFIVVGETFKEEEVILCDNNWLYRVFQLNVELDPPVNSGAYDLPLVEHGTPTIYLGDISFNALNVLDLDGSSYLETRLPDHAGDSTVSSGIVSLAGFFRFNSLINEPTILCLDTSDYTTGDSLRRLYVTADGILTLEVINDGVVDFTYQWPSSERIFINDWTYIGIRIDDSNQLAYLNIDRQVRKAILTTPIIVTDTTPVINKVFIGGDSVNGQNLNGYIGTLDIDYEKFDSELDRLPVSGVSFGNWTSIDVSVQNNTPVSVSISNWEEGDLAVLFVAHEWNTDPGRLTINVTNQSELWSEPDYIDMDLPWVQDGAGRVYQRQLSAIACVDPAMDGTLSFTLSRSVTMDHDPIARYQLMHVKGAYLDTNQPPTEVVKSYYPAEISSARPAVNGDWVGKQGVIFGTVGHSGATSKSISIVSDSSPGSVITLPLASSANSFGFCAFVSNIPEDLRVDVTPEDTLSLRNVGDGDVSVAFRFFEVGREILPESKIQIADPLREQCIAELPDQWPELWDMSNFDLTQNAWVGNSGVSVVRSKGLWPVTSTIRSVLVYCTAFASDEQFFLYGRSGVLLGISQYLGVDPNDGYSIFEIMVDDREGEAIGFLASEDNFSSLPGPFIHRVEVNVGSNRMQLISGSKASGHLPDEGVSAYINLLPIKDQSIYLHQPETNPANFTYTPSTTGGVDMELSGPEFDISDNRFAIIMEVKYGNTGSGEAKVGINDVIEITSSVPVASTNYTLSVLDSRVGATPTDIDHDFTAGPDVTYWSLVWDGAKFAVFIDVNRVYMDEAYPTDLIPGPHVAWGHGLRAEGTGIVFRDFAITKDIDVYTEAMTVDNNDLSLSPSWAGGLSLRFDTLTQSASVSSQLTRAELIERYNPGD